METNEELTLRDRLAIAALPIAYLAHKDECEADGDWHHLDSTERLCVATEAYALADEMLLARKMKVPL